MNETLAGQIRAAIRRDVLVAKIIKVGIDIEQCGISLGNRGGYGEQAKRILEISAMWDRVIEDIVQKKGERL